jgi:hypothetical protein
MPRFIMSGNTPRFENRDGEDDNITEPTYMTPRNSTDSISSIASSGMGLYDQSDSVQNPSTYQFPPPNESYPSGSTSSHDRDPPNNIALIPGNIYSGHQNYPPSDNESFFDMMNFFGSSPRHSFYENRTPEILFPLGPMTISDGNYVGI